MNLRATLFFFMAILLLGLFLRFHQVDQESLWVDEILTIQHALKDSPAEVVEKVSQREGAPFGHYLLLHYWIKIFGSAEFATRLLSVMFGVLSIAVLFLIADLLFGTKVALISSLFMATSMLQVLYSQETRLYAMFTFLSLSSAYFFTKIYLGELRSPNNQKMFCWYFLYFISAIASIYTNYLAGFILLGYTFVLFWNWEKIKFIFPRWAAVHGIIALFSLPLISIILTQLDSIGNNAELTFTIFGVPPFIAQLGLLMFALPMLFLISFLAAAVLCKRKIKRIIKLILRSGDLPPTLFLLVVVLFSAAYTYLVFFPLSVFGIPIFRVPITHSYFLIRHSFFMAPILYLFFAYHISRIPKKIATAAFCIILLTNVLALAAYYSETTKAEWGEAAAYIHEHDGSKPLILLDRGGSTNAYLLEYYLGYKPRMIKLTKSPRGQPLWKIKPQNLFESLENEHTFWLILSGNRETEQHYKEVLQRKYALVESRQFYEVSVYRYENNN